MHLVTDEYQSRDRWVLDVTRLEPGHKKRFRPHGTAYVMLRNASLTSAGVMLKNVTAALTVTEPFTVSTGDGWAAVVDYHGLKLTENTISIVNPRDFGNLSYIDGGSNTNSINPGRNGEPVVNYVYFPSGMKQTSHVHPSPRLGFCIGGKGRTDLKDGSIELKEGDLFYLGRLELHNFVTDDSECVLFSFAPDSETGPTDERNPLLERTYIGR